MNINDVGYNVNIGEAVVDAKGVASSGLSFPCKAIPDGDYLVTLEVNGTVIAGRDKATFASGSATVGDYTLSYESYAVSVATLTDDDVVVLRIEPLYVKVSDAFRAAVGKAGGNAGGGSSVGAYLIHYDSDTEALDKTWNEINAALASGQIVMIVMYSDENGTSVEYVLEAVHEKFGYKVYGFGNTEFSSDDPDAYPVYGSEA